MKSMSDDLRQLERDLRTLSPRQPSPAVKAAVAAAVSESAEGTGDVLAFPPPPSRATNLLRWAAAVAVLVGSVVAVRPLLQPDSTSPTPGPLLAEDAPLPAPAPSFAVPVSVDSVLVHERDAGVVMGPGSRPMRRVEYAVIDRIEYENEREGQRIMVQRPRTEVVLVSMQPD
jgi:hypothetical protein